MKFLVVLLVTLALVAIGSVVATSTIADLTYSRVAYVDIDPLVDNDCSACEENNMNDAVSHVLAQGANTVFIQAYRDSEGYTRVFNMYFPNKHLPDYQNRNLFVKLANKFKAQGIAVGAWMPILAYQAQNINGKPAEYILTRQSDGSVIREPCDASAFYCNLTPFNVDNFNFVLDIYEALLVAYPDLYIINGHDDGAMNADQDMSPSALKAYKAAGFPSTPSDINKMPWDKNPNSQRNKWSEFKSEAISHFFLDLITALRKTKPSLKSSRNFYVNAFAEVTPDNFPVNWFAQSCKSARESADYLAPMIFPYMENQQAQGTGSDKFNWYFNKVIPTLQACEPDMNRWQICLQAVDWKQSPFKPIPEEEFTQWIQTAFAKGAMHIGYYPSNHYDDSTSPIVKNGLLLKEMTRLTQCTSGNQCSAEQHCVDGFCKEELSHCLSDSNCLSTEYCDTVFSNSCTRNCQADTDCAKFTEAKCNKNTMKCEHFVKPDPEEDSGNNSPMQAPTIVLGFFVAMSLVALF